MQPIDVYYDFVCPFVYVTHGRLRLLEAERPLALRWRPWEIHPAAERPGTPNAAGTVSERIRALAAEIDLPIAPPAFHASSHLALLGAEFAERHGRGPAYRDGVFAAHWREGRLIGDLDVLADVAGRAGLDASAFRAGVVAAEDWPALRAADRDAERLGVEYVPTWVLGDELFVASGPFAEHRAALARYEAAAGNGR